MSRQQNHEALLGLFIPKRTLIFQCKLRFYKKKVFLIWRWFPFFHCLFSEENCFFWMFFKIVMLTFKKVPKIELFWAKLKKTTLKIPMMKYFDAIVYKMARAITDVFFWISNYYFFFTIFLICQKAGTFFHGNLPRAFFFSAAVHVEIFVEKKVYKYFFGWLPTFHVPCQSRLSIVFGLFTAFFQKHLTWRWILFKLFIHWLHWIPRTKENVFLDFFITFLGIFTNEPKFIFFLPKTIHQKNFLVFDR